ncbi:hypothetical protein DID88_001919 [Monilinia fructigena]|uniref:Enoyl reductase (ER) domain-containing protein n=1 Tax=Monilinia fructigena TaxID=38457 RepID=A0A395IYG4_9HELO|nr:hypothetical protein DID88_001919 [Monilinia fructigena]
MVLSEKCLQLCGQLISKNGTGHADALYINDSIPKPTPSSGEAIVKVKAFGLNRMDLLQREGHYPVPPQAPKTLGVEFSGTIECLGPNIKEGFNVGDEVFGLAYGGAYAEFIAVSTHMLLKKPGHLSWEEAAGIPETWITATQAMYLVGEFSKGKSILWHAGASSVSISGIQLAKKFGSVSYLCATAGFNYKTQDWAKEILALTDGKGVDIIIDFVGANHFQGNLDVAARDGRIVNLGVMSGTKLPNGVDMGAFVRKRVRFEGSTLRSRDVKYQGKLRDKLEEYLSKFEDGTFRIFVDKVFPWEQVVEAHKEMERNTSKGKIICTIS